MNPEEDQRALQDYQDQLAYEAYCNAQAEAKAQEDAARE